MILCVAYKIDKLIDEAKFMQHRPELYGCLFNLLGEMNSRLTLKIKEMKKPTLAAEGGGFRLNCKL